MNRVFYASDWVKILNSSFNDIELNPPLKMLRGFLNTLATENSRAMLDIDDICHFYSQIGGDKNSLIRGVTGEKSKPIDAGKKIYKEVLKTSERDLAQIKKDLDEQKKEVLTATLTNRATLAVDVSIDPVEMERISVSKFAPLIQEAKNKVVEYVVRAYKLPRARVEYLRDSEDGKIVIALYIGSKGAEYKVGDIPVSVKNKKRTTFPVNIVHEGNPLVLSRENVWNIIEKISASSFVDIGYTFEELKQLLRNEILQGNDIKAESILKSLHSRFGRKAKAEVAKMLSEIQRKLNASETCSEHCEFYDTKTSVHGHCMLLHCSPKDVVRINGKCYRKNSVKATASPLSEYSPVKTLF